MSKPLTNFFIALATGWLSVAAVGWKYVRTVRDLPPVGSGLATVGRGLHETPHPTPGAAINTLGGALSRPVPPSAGSGLERIGRAIGTPPAGAAITRIGEQVRPRPAAGFAMRGIGELVQSRPRPGAGLAQLGAHIPRPPDGPRLPPDLDWSKGSAVVLLVGTNLPDAARRSLGGEVDQIQRELGSHLVGGSVLIADEAGVWTWAEWLARPANERRPFAAEGAGFAPAFAAVAADLAAITRKRAGAKTESLVVWHSAVAPEETPAAELKVPAVLIWSGKPFTEQRANKVLPKVFAKVDPCGPDLTAVAGAVKNRLE